MTKSAILDATEGNSPKELHRIIPFSRLLEILRDKKNVLVYPTVWNDPYEAVELRTTLAYPLFKDSNDGSIKVGMPFIGEPIRAGIIEYGSPADFSYYCQSWSAATESETMWRAYSPDSDAVRVTVCVDKLLEQTVQALPDYAIYLGKVSYFSDEEIKWFAAQGDDNRKLQSRLVLEGSPWGISWARSLMKKTRRFPT